MPKRNVPNCVIENCKCYNLTKKRTEDHDYYLFETKIISEYNEADPLDSKVMNATFYIKTDIFKKNFGGQKQTDLIGQCFDLYVDYVPFNRSWTGKDGNRYSKTEWNPYVNDLMYTGVDMSDADDSKFPNVDQEEEF